MKRIGSYQKGFTLVELIMAMVVAGIIAVPLSIFLGQQIESVFQSEDYTIALNLARHEIESVKNMAYSDIASATSQYPGYPYDVIRTVTFAYGNQLSQESLKAIRVDVARSDADGTVLVSLVTYIAKNVSYGAS